MSCTDNGFTKLERFKHLWYHRTDTVSFDNKEINMRAALVEFVKGGGNLFLSMESVPLLNRWGIESNSIQLEQDTVKDEGFGRPLGYHAFKSHPIFAGLLGGVYTSKQKTDHTVRKYGFFGDNFPKEGKVIGIQWTYITFTEQNKVLLEYDLGKGKIIAAGAYLYYGTDNYQQDHLAMFTQNVFRYTANDIKGIKKYNWDYSEKQIVPFEFKLPALPLLPASAWQQDWCFIFTAGN